MDPKPGNNYEVLFFPSDMMHQGSSRPITRFIFGDENRQHTPCKFSFKEEVCLNRCDANRCAGGYYQGKKYLRRDVKRSVICMYIEYLGVYSDAFEIGWRQSSWGAFRQHLKNHQAYKPSSLHRNTIYPVSFHMQPYTFRKLKASSPVH
ncbi:hypothetical protein AVEN_108373-1 [Araneus ventricosus]|uniref:Uncharacterized protein n=1 Tax=Araneus ventricosus TaxID=182803 RepID=A0A4Y2CX02_ARAVE|nr:hypothetical protein AVEN_108373-1 [Araneus ventricosus]